MNYNNMTIAQLKEEIVRRTAPFTKTPPFNSKTKKADLIGWLTFDDAQREAARLVREVQRHEEAQLKAYRMAPVLHKTTVQRLIEYYMQSGSEKLTVRQQRAIRKSQKREMARYAR